MEAGNKSSWRIADKIGEHDSFRRLTQDYVSLDPVKLGEMAKPKVAGRNEPPRNIRAREFKEDEKKVELARQRKCTKEARARRRIPIDPTIPPWRRGFYTTIDSFLAAHDVDRMGESNIAAEAKANENNANQNENTSGAIVLYQVVASNTNA
uniref:Uncharacterized protein n=1 Tax=Solanum tuberosum TaxID=4113 RepID=M1DNU7_SOLTU